MVMTPNFTPPSGITTITSWTTFMTGTTANASTVSEAVNATNSSSVISTAAISFPSVAYPFIWVGVSMGTIGLLSAVLGYRELRVTRGPMMCWKLGCVGLVLILLGYFLMGYTLRGSGWVIALYFPQGLYLFAIGIGIGLYTIFAISGTQRSAIMLSVGVVLAGFLLLMLYGAYTDFLPRCFADVGCNSELARNTVFWVMVLGLLLALATFIMGYGAASFRKTSDMKCSKR